MLAVHGAVFPFDAEWSLVVDAVEGADDGFEIDLASSWGSEVPASSVVTEGEMSAEDGVGAGEGGGGVFDVDVEDAVGEVVDELDGVESLPDQV